VLADDGGEEVVGRAGVGHRGLRIRLHLDAGSGQRQHLHVDAVPSVLDEASLGSARVSGRHPVSVIGRT